jgi:hypothetical protein
MMRENLSAVVRSVRDVAAVALCSAAVGLAAQWALTRVTDHVLISIAVIFSFAAMIQQRPLQPLQAP